ncbi:MAG: hypothetical protein WC375_05260 [Methanomassiliicoccales archaeon]|jgi:hypothetical protein
MTALTVEMRFVREDLTELKKDMKDLKDRPCPSALCMQCQTDIAQLKTTNDNRKDSGATAVAWAAIIVALVAAFISILPQVI